MIRTDSDSVRAWVVYPERRERAPVVVVIHEIFGLTSWIRSVADQLAAAGHGFLRAQDGKDGANMAAARQTWPARLAFFRRHLVL